MEHTFFTGLAAFFDIRPLHAFWDGQPPGKKLSGIRVVRESSGRLGVGAGGRPQAAGRALIRLRHAGAPLGLGRILFDPRKQALHDKAARTAVVIA
ncbi:RDD family protein [Nonomuraea sp. NPDC049309]|uniref:RDD family protein n=1 Tax=Nonomuraea sp. NPDC049309 TaxID=3364350 RepID=UPI0037151CB3